MTILKKFSTLVAASLAITGALFGNVEQASARDGQNAAFFGGLATGAILGGAFVGQSHGYNNDEYYNRDYDQYPTYRPAYRSYSAYDDDEAPVVVRHCYRVRREVYDDWGDFAGYRRVKVCN